MSKGKALIRAVNRSGTDTRKTRPAERAGGRLAEPVLCDRCGAVFARRVWRHPHRVTTALLERATWRRCPACAQVGGGVYWGRVVVRGSYLDAHEEAIRRRIANVGAWARATQPQRRLVSVERVGATLEVLTTSQKLAHRIVLELRKAFRGRTQYRWSDDGSLFAVWERAGG